MTLPLFPPDPPRKPRPRVKRSEGIEAFKAPGPLAPFVLTHGNHTMWDEHPLRVFHFDGYPANDNKPRPQTSVRLDHYYACLRQGAVQRGQRGP